MRPRLSFLVLALWLPVTTGGAVAQSTDPDSENGLGLIERGIGLLLENFMTDIAPQLDIIGNHMAEGLDRLGPALRDMGVLIDDIANYQTPERLENGDILIRRKPGAPPPPKLGHDLSPDPPDPDFIDPNMPQIEL